MIHDKLMIELLAIHTSACSCHLTTHVAGQLLPTVARNMVTCFYHQRSVLSTCDGTDAVS